MIKVVWGMHKQDAIKSCRIGECPQCKKRTMLIHECSRCKKLFCSDCDFLNFQKYDDVSYRTPEKVEFICKKCSKKVKYGSGHRTSKDFKRSQ